MDAWFHSLSSFEQIALPIAIFGTFFFVIKLILQLIGFGSNATDLDGDGIPDDFVDLDGDGICDGTELADAVDATDSLHLFTFHGMALLLAMGGWSAMAAYSITDSSVISAIIGCVVGFISAYIHALIMRAMFRLESDGTARKKNGIGKLAKVYLVIPKQGDGEGKINVKINGQLQEMRAICRDPEPIPTGSKVRVTELTPEGIYVVERDDTHELAKI